MRFAVRLNPVEIEPAKTAALQRSGGLNECRHPTPYRLRYTVLRYAVSCLCFVLFLFASAVLQADVDLEKLQSEFRSPPDSARPWVYLFVMDGNFSKEGITADLEAMKRAGIGGMILMEIYTGVPRGNVKFMSEEWQDTFVHLVRESERLGLELTLVSGPGWTGSGGPWITPEHSMLHLTASELNVSGPDKFNAELPLPVPRKPFFGENQLPAEIEKARKEWFKDVKVIAFPSPEGNKKTADIDEKALYYRKPYSSDRSTKPYLESKAEYSAGEKDAVIETKKSLDLTDKFKDGKLTWDVPEGKWTILRLAATSTGANTRPAPLPGMGLESSKLDKNAFDIHAVHYLNKLLQKTGKTASERAKSAGGLKYFHIDSWEMGSQNYSETFFAEFAKRRGYDPMPYLPAYLGYVTESREITERFLWDVRQTAQEVMIENHGEYLRETAHKNGMKLSIEPYDMMPCNDMSFGAAADVPMGEFWFPAGGFLTAFACWEAASVGHIHGRQVVAAEAFTGNGGVDRWRFSPKTLKQQGDWAFCAGINRFVFHRYQHQPLPDKYPGFSMGQYGIHWERTQPWWEMSQDYHRYLARCQFLLQKGKPVADILYLEQEGAPVVFTPPASALVGKEFFRDHRGYRFDGCDPMSFLKLADVKKENLVDKDEVARGTTRTLQWKSGSKIVFPSGAEYQVLVLPNVETMTLPMAQKIEKMVNAGALVIGQLPKKSPSLQGYPKADDEIKIIAERVNRKLIAPPESKELYPSYDFTADILKQKVAEDFTSKGNSLRYFHTRDGGMDIYFVSNRSEKPFADYVQFRESRRKESNAEHSKILVIFDPLTGKAYQGHLSASIQTDEGLHGTNVPVKLDGGQSLFYLFIDTSMPGNAAFVQYLRLPMSLPLLKGETTTAADGTVIKSFDWDETLQPVKTAVPADLNADWTVTFHQKQNNETFTLNFPQLTDWSKHADERVKYFSGTATYTKEFTLNEKPGSGKIYLDLGNVEVMARVTLNGKEVRTVWAPPYRVEITEAVREGKNELKIETANQWVNRLIGDAKLPAEKRTTWSTWQNVWKADSPLLPAGLLGPVQIQRSE
ncbi:MAG: hypothetical protein LBH00_05030 [Planctomycetaceae bacterium]|jgi:hypothetical protein|nr:hypothetical protein [Planctomycetaceae bacterium]